MLKEIETRVRVDEVSEGLSVAERVRIEPKAFTELSFVFALVLG